MNDLSVTAYNFDPAATFTKKLNIDFENINPNWVSIFDQNGYILTKLEQLYYDSITEHRGPWEHSFQKPWFTQLTKTHGAVLNHALIFQRKGFSEEAYDQLASHARQIPLLWKVAKIRPKWGIDFSIDWSDFEGNVFEILHFEWDGFSFDEVIKRKQYYENLFKEWDWDDIARSMLAKKQQWYDLDFFAQSAWKCDYLGIEHEQFKMVCWQ